MLRIRRDECMPHLGSYIKGCALHNASPKAVYYMLFRSDLIGRTGIFTTKYTENLHKEHKGCRAPLPLALCP